MTDSRPTAEGVRRLASVFAVKTGIALSGLNPKVRLLLLCARIGYSPHASFQR